MITLTQTHFNPYDTFTCGQCFRWEAVDGRYIGVVENAVLEVVPRGDVYDVHVVLGEMSEAALRHYFDCHVSYDVIKAYLSKKDHWLLEAVSAGSGIRLLNQAPLETLMTFIVSSNNNIPKIKMAVKALAETFGTCLGTYEGTPYYAFPTLEVLAKQPEAAFKVKGMGYRNKAIYETAQALYTGKVDLSAPYRLDYNEGKVFLKQFYGIGDKVADCILLFAYEKKNAFPIDTWVKRLLRELYVVEDAQKAYEAFVGAYFKRYGGYAQQYLFHYMRNKKS